MIISVGVGIDAAVVRARTVTDWAPYGVDLRSAQSAKKIAMGLSRLDPDW